MQNFHEISTFFYRKNILSKVIFISLLSFITAYFTYFNINFNISNFISTSNAETIEKNKILLQKFLQETTTWTANFEQIILLDTPKNADSNHKNNAQQTKKTQGKVYLFRPNKFKWQIDKPYTQIIIGNGDKIWLDDQDLQQTTIKKSTELLEASPMALLAGKNNLNADFNITNLPPENENTIKNSIKNSVQNSKEISNIVFLLLTPKKESSFIEIILGLNSISGEPVIMQLVDNLNQRNQIIFSDSQKNVKLPNEMFNFIIPKDRDVIEN